MPSVDGRPVAAGGATAVQTTARMWASRSPAVRLRVARPKPLLVGCEAGSSAVTFVMVLPLLCIFLCAALDFGRVVSCQMMLSDAAHAAADWGGEKISAGTTLPLANAAAREAALKAAPALAGDGFDVEVSCGRPSEVGFTRRVYSPESGTFSATKVQLGSREVEARATFKGTYLTVVGRAVAAASGAADGSFSLEATARRSAYEPEGGGDGQG